MKISGADFVAWQKSDWGHDDAHWDDFELRINGVVVKDYEVNKIDPSAKVEVWGGVVYLGEGKEVSAQTHFKRWKKAQTHENVTFSVPKETVAEFITAAGGFGASVLK